VADRFNPIHVNLCNQWAKEKTIPWEKLSKGQRTKTTNERRNNRRSFRGTPLSEGNAPLITGEIRKFYDKNTDRF
jgi:hypothetical protein